MKKMMFEKGVAPTFGKKAAPAAAFKPCKDCKSAAKCKAAGKCMAKGK